MFFGSEFCFIKALFEIKEGFNKIISAFLS